jgi:hypothetical protein
MKTQDVVLQVIEAIKREHAKGNRSLNYDLFNTHALADALATLAHHDIEVERPVDTSVVPYSLKIRWVALPVKWVVLTANHP